MQMLKEITYEWNTNDTVHVKGHDFAIICPHCKNTILVSIANVNQGYIYCKECDILITFV